MSDLPRIDPLGSDAVTVSFGNEISTAANDKAVALASHFLQNPFPGFIEGVPAYSSVAIFYDLSEVRRHMSQAGTAFDAVSDLIRSALRGSLAVHSKAARTIEIPVDFSDSAALDLDVIAGLRGLSKEEAIELFVSRTYRVYMLGFLPGFAYMGEVDESIAVPRRESPRMKVAKGSVGIAGRQTGIYPVDSPGGWQIIGRTNVEMFSPYADPPGYLQAGDEVRFVVAD